MNTKEELPRLLTEEEIELLRKDMKESAKRMKELALQKYGRKNLDPSDNCIFQPNLAT